MTQVEYVLEFFWTEMSYLPKPSYSGFAYGRIFDHRSLMEALFEVRKAKDTSTSTINLPEDISPLTEECFYLEIVQKGNLENECGNMISKSLALKLEEKGALQIERDESGYPLRATQHGFIEVTWLTLKELELVGDLSGYEQKQRSIEFNALLASMKSLESFAGEEKTRLIVWRCS